MALDVSGDRGTFRSQIYPEYKAQRPDPPEDLFPQVDRCLAMLKSIGVPVIGAEGFEADDVMATLVTRLRREHPELKIRLVSKDKDLKQLLESVPRGEGTHAVVELFDVHTDTAFSAETLEAETGLKPAQVIDMLALMGDSVDNVPGVEGVGEKTAAALIKEWGAISRLIEHAHELKGKRGEKIREAAAQLDLSRSLVTLRRDVPLEFRVDDASVANLDLGAMIPILKELGFNRYQDEVRALTGQPPARGSWPNSNTAPTATPASKENPRALDFMQPGAERHPPRPSPGAQGGLFDHVEHVSSEPRKAQSGEYRAIITKAQLSALVNELADAEVISLDTETTSLCPRDAKLCGVSLSVKPGTGVYIPIRSPETSSHLDESTVLDALRPILEDPNRPKCGHNLKYDIQILREAGVRLRGLDAPGSCDSMVASYLLDASRSSHGLDSLALALLGRTNISISELIGSGKEQRTFDTVPVALAAEYAAEDADVALQLRAVMMPQLDAAGLMPLMRDVEMPLVDVLAELEHNGILVDPAELERQRTRLAARIEEILARLHSESFAAIGRRFDPDSPKQLSAVLFNPPEADPPGLGLKSIKKTKTGHSTDAEVLEKLADDAAISTPIPRFILEYRQLSKLVSTYLVALKDAIHPRTKRVHTSFSQTVAATGRLASSDPNLQNIPIRTEVGRDIRRAFLAPPGRVLITADYSQIELRLLAHLSRDPALIEAFRQGEDIHAAVAAQIHAVPIDTVTKEQRGGAKMVNFGIVYGITAYGLARRLNIDEKAAAEIITQYKKRFSGITTFLQECVEQARSKGYVETMLKRRRPIPDVDSTNPSRRALAERLAINSVVQGSAADLIKLAMVDLHRRLASGEKLLRGVLMLLQIHDELVFESPEDTAPAARDLIVARMEQAMDLHVPLKADAHIARNWHEGK